MKQKSITIYDIAREANVSSATVSRVIAGNYPVSEKTKKKVFDLIEKYDYQPNAVARSLTKKESKMIGVILPDITNPFFAQVFIEAEKYALTKGYTLILCNSMNSSELESRHLRVLSERQVEGIIFMGGRINKTHPEVSEINELKYVIEKIPVILVNGRMETLECPSISTNEAKGIELIIDHLVKQGHTKIGLIGGMTGITTTDIKVEAFRQNLEKHKLAVVDSWQIYSGYDVKRGKEAMEEMLEVNKHNLPTAIIGINDLVVIGALKLCHQKKINNFSFVGFDDSELTQNSIPEITSVSHPYNELGEKAVDMLIKSKTTDSKAENLFIDPHLVVRESTI
ncbi:LacI family DNA-binding transcriptional regulator [Gracilibacillus thailandensis]|uniref:LacI family DNA-binding transcriptional regulator n=1 Tax=Gracilibacillus thailandensis TaxID=563735 RepID=A0A6N7QZ05_9BACI|nr:LacI family DNA-binding transcriptional regulator [Gracilibacillus thailandensis]MRI67373.1 LacI family DNA-binding transcriptional regulator [Gracilibacillus thailandensis]